MGEVEDDAEDNDYLMDLRFLNSEGSEKESYERCKEIEIKESSADSDYRKFLRREELCFYDRGQDPEKEEGLDSEYELFLNNLEEGKESFSVETSSTSDPEEEDDLDSQYCLFLNNLKVDGQLFSYELHSSSGVTVYRFEESSSEEEVERKRTSKRDSRKLKAEVPEKKAKAGERFSKIGDEGSRSVVRGVPSKGRKKAVNVDEIREEDEDEDEDDCILYKLSGEPLKKMKPVIADPSYEKLFNSLAKQGKKPKAVKKFPTIGGERSKNKLRDVPSEGRNGAVNVEEIKVEDEDETDFIACKPSGEPSKKMNCVFIEESHDNLLNSFAKRGKKILASNESAHRSRHQKDDETSSDLQIFALDNIPFHEGGCTPFVPSKCYQSLTGEESWEVIENSSRSLFREKLTNLLKKPYDEKEFQTLWREVIHRKPVQRSKELRNGRTKVYSTKTEGKSYLDWYNELKVKIEEFRPDKCKILYLLRGFFFWLENTAHEGAFQPWFDSLYLKALP